MSKLQSILNSRAGGFDLTTEEGQIAAIEKDYHNISLINSPSKKIINKFFDKIDEFFDEIINPSESACLEYLKLVDKYTNDQLYGKNYYFDHHSEDTFYSNARSIISKINFSHKNQCKIYDWFPDWFGYLSNPNKKLLNKIISEEPSYISSIRNPSIELQKLAIESSNYDPEVIIRCPDWKQFEQEIEDNLIIKDIIE